MTLMTTAFETWVFANATVAWVDVAATDTFLSACGRRLRTGGERYIDGYFAIVGVSKTVCPIGKRYHLLYSIGTIISELLTS